MIEGSMEVEVDSRKAILYKGRPLGDVPVTYKRVKVCSHNIGNRYNPSTLTLYRARDGSLRYEIYRDGCIFPYYGKITFLE